MPIVYATRQYAPFRDDYRLLVEKNCSQQWCRSLGKLA
jgi:hypothetical protein